MERKDIFDVVRDFFALLNSPNTSEDEFENVRALVRVLDDLARAYHFVIYEFDGQANDPPAHDLQLYSAMRNLAGSKFPTLGDYSTVDPLEVPTSEILTGDALDDIADIACDLQDVLWCLENTSESNALFHFQIRYDSHWGRHLRYLQVYLYEILH
ncbi:MAG: hypothetical protein RIR73_2667 [Chloroflexota bacterium]|jgi:hypothetical protein